MTKRAHSAHGASSAKRYFACPGSIRACEGLPDKPSEYAAEGTRAHHLAQTCLENGETDARDYIGVPMECPEAGAYTPDVDMADAVNVYLDAIYNVLHPEDSLYVEQSFELKGIAKGAALFGTNDCCILKPDGTLHVFDYKHGVGVMVEVEDNPQLRYYALGAVQNIPGAETVREIVTTIVQPRYNSLTVPPVRSETVSRFDLLEWAADLRVAVEATLQPDAPRVAGAHCRFCRAAGTCEAFRAAAVKAATDPFGEIADPSTFDADELGKRLEQAEILRHYLIALDTAAKTCTANGQTPTGWKWIIGSRRRAWIEERAEALAETFEQATGVDIRKVTVLSPAQAEKAVGKREFAKVSDQFVFLKPTAPKLVKESDKSIGLTTAELRAALKISAFAEMED